MAPKPLPPPFLLIISLLRFIGDLCWRLMKWIMIMMKDKLYVCVCVCARNLISLFFLFFLSCHLPHNHIIWQRTETILLLPAQLKLILIRPDKNETIFHRRMIYFSSSPSQIDLRHLLQSPDSDVIDIGIDLQDYYISVEWEILKVPAIRNEKVSRLAEKCQLFLLIISKISLSSHFTVLQLLWRTLSRWVNEWVLSLSHWEKVFYGIWKFFF